MLEKSLAFDAVSARIMMVMTICSNLTNHNQGKHRGDVLSVVYIFRAIFTAMVYFTQISYDRGEDNTYAQIRKRGGDLAFLNN